MVLNQFGIIMQIQPLPLLEINRASIQEPLDKICNNNEWTYDHLVEKIKSIPRGVIPYTLEEWGIMEDQLD